MNRLTFTRSHVRGKKCSLCQTPRRTYVSVSYELGTGFYLICAACIDGLIGGLDAGESTLPVPKDFITGVKGWAKRHE